MQGLLNDLRVGLRVMRRSPMVTGVTVLTTALGIGATTSIFCLVNGIYLKPLPYPEPDDLVALWTTLPGAGFERFAQGAAFHYTYEEQARTLESVGLWGSGGTSLSTPEGARRLQGIWLTWGTLEALGVQPVLGRRFTAQDDAGGAPCTVMLDHDFWQGGFGGRRDVLNETMNLDGETCDIIGVMPKGRFLSDYSPSLYLPFRIDRTTLVAGQFSYQSLARLAQGVTLEDATAELTWLTPVVIQAYPGGMTVADVEGIGFAPVLAPLKTEVLGRLGSRLWIIFAAAGLLLLIAVANVANLILVQADGRERDVAIRTAVGASRGRVIRQFLLENTLLALVGGLLGISLGYGGLEVIRATNPGGLPRMSEVSVDPVVLLFALGVSTFTGIVFGLFPVLRFRRNNLVSSLKEGNRSGGAGPKTNRTRNALAVAQIAAALVLLVGSGLIFRSFRNLSNVDPGFDNPETILTLNLSIPEGEVPDLEEAIRTHQLIGDRISAIPGVTSVGLTSKLPMTGGSYVDPLWVEGEPRTPGTPPPVMQRTWVGGTYFQAMGIPLLAGRYLTRADATEKTPVVVVSESMARAHWPNPADAIGKRVSGGVTPGEGGWREVVGVVGDVRDNGIAQDPPPISYWPLITPRTGADSDAQAVSGPRYVRYAIRSDRVGSPDLVPAVRAAIASVNPNLPPIAVQSMDAILAYGVARTTFMLSMLGIGGLVAFFLGLAGAYGVVSYVVTQRTRELGVRIAMGAGPEAVRRLVLKQGMMLALFGVGIGLGVSFWASRLMEAFLFGVEAVDPVTFGAVALGLLSTTLLACLIPARRAARIDPVVALKGD